MTIAERAAKVLAEIDAALEMEEKATPGPWTAIHGDANATARTLLPAALRCLKTAIDALENEANSYRGDGSQKNALHAIATLCDQWQSKL